MVVLGALSLVFAAFLASFMTEEGFDRQGDHEHSGWQSAIAAWKQGAAQVRRNRALLVIVVSMVIMGMADEAIDRLDVLRLIEIGLPTFTGEDAIIFFGVVWGAMTPRTGDRTVDRVGGRRLDDPRHCT